MERIFTSNVYTDRGDREHERVHESGRDAGGGVTIERALPLAAPKLGVHGVADVVEFHADGTIVPIEHKVGRRAQRDADDIQVAAQALALEEMFDVEIVEARIYHHGSRRRRDVVIDEALRRQVANVIYEVSSLLDSQVTPAPVNDARCPPCSLIDSCMPDVIDGEDLRHDHDPTFDPAWGETS